MTVERDRFVYDIVREALELELDARDEFLRRQCGADLELRREADALLARVTQSRTRPPSDAVARGLIGALRDQSTRASAGAPEQIGSYRIVREIGRGGMGVVYEALQQHPRRSVAVKVLHPLFASPSSVRRLEREAEILARFQHPGIAQIFDAGSFEGAHGMQPYLVMELVEGGDLATFVHKNALDARRKVELVVAICDAIGHAHERDVVHRDLKPGNILVDARGCPKVLDFGVARSLDADVQRTTMSTESGSIVGTLAYMSPEQVMGDLAAIDARSDVYALGAVLFELLTGRLPILVDGLSFARAIQVVRDEEPLPLSALDRSLRGDLEIIVGKALAKESDRRYANARELAADLKRYLANEPIVARRPSTIYRFKMFARRRRALVAGIGVAFVSLAAVAVVTFVKTIEARHESRRLRALNTFLVQKLLQAPDPSQMGRDVKVVDLFDRARRELETSFLDDPEIRADMLHTLGTCYRTLTLHKEASDLLQEAVKLRAENLGADAADTLHSKLELARELLAIDRLDDAIALFRAVESNGMRVFGPTSEEVLSARMGAAEALNHTGKSAEALVIAQDALAVSERTFGESHDVTFRGLITLFYVQERTGDLATAEKTAQKMLDVSRRVRGEDHVDTLRARFMLANVWLSQGRDNEAGELLIKLLADYERVFGPDSVATSDVRTTVAVVYESAGNMRAAGAESRRALAAYVATLGPEHRTVFTVKNNIAIFLRKTGELEESEKLAQEALDGRKRVLGAEDPDTGSSWNTIGVTHASMKEYAKAQAELEESLRISRAAYGDDHPQVTSTQYNLAELLRKRGDFAAAERAFRELLERDLRQLAPESGDVLSDWLRIAQCAQGQGHWAEAEKIARDTLAIRERTSGPASNAALLLRNVLGQSLLAQDKLDEAEVCLLAAWEGFNKNERADLIEDEQVRERLAELYRRRNQPEKAAEFER